MICITSLLALYVLPVKVKHARKYYFNLRFNHFNWVHETVAIGKMVLLDKEDIYIIFVKLTHKNERVLNDNDVVTEYLSCLHHIILVYHINTVVHNSLSDPCTISEVDSISTTFLFSVFCIKIWVQHSFIHQYP